MTLDFYYNPISPPCRLVQLVAAALDVELNFKLINIQAGDHLKPEYLKINPQHTIPTLVDNNFAVTESRAICRYLIGKYGGANSFLYPQDLKTRTLVDQTLDFDLGTLYGRFSEYFWPQLFASAPKNEAVFKKLQDGLKILNTLLEGRKYVVGPKLTLADLALVVTISTIEASGIIDLEQYPNITKWYALVKSTAPKYDEANGKGNQMLKDFLATVKL